MMKPSHVTVRVPATTANLGPGFDCLGIALQLYNTVTVRRGEGEALSPMFRETAKVFFQAAGVPSFPFSVRVQGRVPRSRGLGSSVTVRLGLLAGLNVLTGKPLSEPKLLSLVIQLEGHPDNAVPAFHGGFAACTGSHSVTAPVLPRLKFVALIPETTLETKAARHVLPKKVALSQAVGNLQNTALLTAAFCLQRYEMLPGLFGDHLHQPYRARLLPALPEVIAAAEKAGALGGFLSGSGSTMMAVTLSHPEKVAAAMRRVADRLKVSAETLILKADNAGYVIR